MKAVAKGLLGIEVSEEDFFLLKDLSDTFKNCANTPIPSSLWKFIPSFRKNQRTYQEHIERILQKQIEKIRLSNVESLEQDQGLFVQEVIKKIEQNPNRKDLHKDPELKSLILLLLGVDNLNLALYESDFQSFLLGGVAKEVHSTKVVEEGGGKINSAILMSQEEMPSLHRLYKISVDSGQNPIILRYVQNGMKCGEHQVPAGTYLAITAPSEERSPLNAFSTGRRSCPAKSVAEAIFKTLIVAEIYHTQTIKRNEISYHDLRDYLESRD